MRTDAESVRRTVSRQVLSLFEPPSVGLPRQRLPDIGPRYQLECELGCGSRGVVFRAEDVKQGRKVAVKLLQGFSDPDARKRFRREGLCCSLVQHENVVQVYAFVKCRSGDALVMEYVAGRTLDRLIRPGGLPAHNCVLYANQIADGLAGIHQAGVVHRDVKPHNIIVARGRKVKLFDFGLAKLETCAGSAPAAFTDAETIDGTILGTLGYMSPEQVLGQPTDARSDIFSFGVVLFEMLTGERAFCGPNAKATMD